jgi:hypothetical protein
MSKSEVESILKVSPDKLVRKLKIAAAVETIRRTTFWRRYCWPRLVVPAGTYPAIFLLRAYKLQAAWCHQPAKAT